jgi:hypothetical protein
MRDLSHLYKAWCDLDLDKFDKAIDSVELHLNDPRIKGEGNVSAENIENIHGQLKFLKGLKAGDRHILLINFYILGNHYREMGRRDFAVLLFYRTIEGCLTRRIEMKYPGFNCKQPNYSLIMKDNDRLNKKFRDAHEAAGISAGITGLPDYALGYMNSALLLYSLDDEIFSALIKNGEKDPLSRLRTLSDCRNNSILAHGFNRISSNKSNNMQQMASDLLKVFWELDKSNLYSFEKDVSHFIADHRDSDLKAICEKLAFVAI